MSSYHGLTQSGLGVRKNRVRKNVLRGWGSNIFSPPFAQALKQARDYHELIQRHFNTPPCGPRSSVLEVHHCCVEKRAGRADTRILEVFDESVCVVQPRGTVSMCVSISEAVARFGHQFVATWRPAPRLASVSMAPLQTSPKC